MNEKLSFQSISDALARKSGVSKKVADTFSKAFFDTIVEALMAGEAIKIKGLGTFKLVEVGDRESVNVSTGKRFVIPGYKKVAFTAEDRVVEVLNEHTETESGAISHTEETHTEEIHTEKVSEKEEQDIDTLIQVPEPEQVETPQDAFAGIDMLISTPESVEDIRQQYEEAKAKMETAVEEARKANAEKIRLEKLLERLEKNEVPEEKGAVIVLLASDNPEAPDSLDTPDAQESSEPAGPSEEEKRQEAFKRVMTEQPHTEEPEPQTKKEGNKKFWYITLIILLVAVLGIFVYMIYRNIEAVEHVQTAEQVKPAKTTQPAQATKPTKPSKPEKPSAPKADKDSLAKAQKADSIKVAANAQKTTQTQQKETPKPEVQKPDASKEKPQKPAKEERPKTHRMQRGESLTRISQKYYGTKDSVRAILRVNTFANPDNIPVGAVVKLP